MSIELSCETRTDSFSSQLGQEDEQQKSSLVILSKLCDSQMFLNKNYYPCYIMLVEALLKYENNVTMHMVRLGVLRPLLMACKGQEGKNNRRIERHAVLALVNLALYSDNDCAEMSNALKSVNVFLEFFLSSKLQNN